MPNRSDDFERPSRRERVVLPTVLELPEAGPALYGPLAGHLTVFWARRDESRLLDQFERAVSMGDRDIALSVCGTVAELSASESTEATTASVDIWYGDDLVCDGVQIGPAPAGMTFASFDAERFETDEFEIRERSAETETEFVYLIATVPQRRDALERDTTQAVPTDVDEARVRLALRNRRRLRSRRQLPPGQRRVGRVPSQIHPRQSSNATIRRGERPRTIPPETDLPATNCPTDNVTPKII